MSDKIIKLDSQVSELQKFITDTINEIAEKSDLVNNTFNMLKISTSAGLPENKFKVIDQKHLQKITDKLPEITDKMFAFGKGDTQFTRLSMTLDMIDFTPMRKIRQIFAQLENKRAAIKDNAIRVRKNYIRLKQLKQRYEEETDPLKKERIEILLVEKTMAIADGLHYYEAAIKEMGMLLQAYEDIKRHYDIPDNWDEEYLEKAEVEEHIKSAFRNLLRDLRTSGKPGMGTQEYLEQLGINPVQAQMLCTGFLNSQYERTERWIKNQLKEGEPIPDYNELRIFLDKMYEIFKDAPIKKLESMGLKPMYEDWIYKSIDKT